MSIQGKKGAAGPLLDYRGVEISYSGRPVAEEISFSLSPGEILAVVGESGSGKSSLLRAAMGLLGPGGEVTRGEISFQGRNLTALPEGELRHIRGRQMGMLFQDAGGTLCPVRKIGDQIYQSLSAHGRLSKRESDARALALLEKLGLPEGRQILDSYPFQLSGGMSQRVGMALAMLPAPKVLLADEPTSALDVVSQRLAVEELLALRRAQGTAILLVTHNIGVAAAMADTLLVLHRGRIAEYGRASQVLRQPQGAYTKELLAAVPRLARRPGKRGER